MCGRSQRPAARTTSLAWCSRSPRATRRRAPPAPPARCGRSGGRSGSCSVGTARTAVTPPSGRRSATACPRICARVHPVRTSRWRPSHRSTCSTMSGPRRSSTAPCTGSCTSAGSPTRPAATAPRWPSTWNLWWRFGAWDRRCRTIARVLDLVDADVLGLQEVWSTERENQAEALAARLGMHFVWAPSPRPERWQERIGDRSVAVGTAILSRWPLADYDVRALEGAAMPALHVVVDTPSVGEGRVLGARRFGTAPVDGIWASDHFGVLAHIATVGPA
jgi:hypothetical protein